MAAMIRIKRSETSGNPSTLGQGELAYSGLADSGANGGDRLYIGMGTETTGNAVNHVVIGGKYFTDKLDHVPGVLTASSALITDASSVIDHIKVGNIDLASNTITTTNVNGNLTISTNGTGLISLAKPTNVVSPTTKALGSNSINVFSVVDSAAAALFEVRQNGDAIIGGVLTVNGAGTSTFTGSVNIGDALTVTNGATINADFTGNNLAITGNFSVDGNSTFGNAAADTITVTGSFNTGLIPLTTNTYDIGSSTKRWANLYAQGTSLLGDVSISSSAVTTTTANGNLQVSGNGTGKVQISGAYTLPNVDGSANYVLTTNGSGVTSWAQASGSLSISGDTGTDSITLLSDTLAFVGGDGITSTVTNNTVTMVVDSTVIRTTGSQSMTDKTMSTGSTWNGNTVGVAYGGTGTTNGSITGTGALTFTSGGTNTSVNLVPNGTGTVDVASKRITSVAEPTQSQDAATKGYVDAVKTGLDVKDSVKVATTAALTVTTAGSGAGKTLTNAGTQEALVIDSIVLAPGDRVLVKDQAAANHNGIYSVTDVGSASTNWVMTRTTDADNTPTGEVTSGMYTFVEAGTVNSSNGYLLITNNPIVLDTTSLAFSQFSGAGQVVAGGGLTKTGNTINAVAGLGITVNADDIALASSVAGNGLTYTTGVLDVVGTTNRISVTSDAIDISTSYVGQTSITTLGTVGTGVWQGTAVGAAYGGTGRTTSTTNGILYGNGTGVMGVTAASTIDGSFLRADSTGAPYFSNSIDGGTY